LRVADLRPERRFGSLGLALRGLFKLQAQPAPAAARAKSVINIYLPSGIAAQESFDPKLLVPITIEYRGPLGAVKTKLDGIYFSEHKDLCPVAS
jgi:hypothetical protein